MLFKVAKYKYYHFISVYIKRIYSFDPSLGSPEIKPKLGFCVL